MSTILKSLPVLIVLLALLAGTDARAQIGLGLSGNHVWMGETGRLGAGIVTYVPLAGYDFEIVPGFEYYHGAWSRRGQEPQSVFYSIGVDVHSNLPVLLSFFRPYAGIGFSYSRLGDLGGAGATLKSGTYVRLLGPNIFPFAQVSYRLIPALREQRELDAVFVQAGVRFGR